MAPIRVGQRPCLRIDLACQSISLGGCKQHRKRYFGELSLLLGEDRKVVERQYTQSPISVIMRDLSKAFQDRIRLYPSHERSFGLRAESDLAKASLDALRNELDRLEAKALV